MFFKSKFELGPYGDGLDKSYLIVRLLDKNQVLKFTRTVAKLSKDLDKEEDIDKSLDDSEKLIEIMYKLVQDQFVEGNIQDTEERPMKKADIDNFPPAVVKDLVQFIEGALEKKV